MSQPSWAAWIEIENVKNYEISGLGRSPLGLRGLKLQKPGLFCRCVCRSPLGLRGLKC